eukprot:4770300-Pleurochrysis_carterae.AAC.2
MFLEATHIDPMMLSRNSALSASFRLLPSCHLQCRFATLTKVGLRGAASTGQRAHQTLAQELRRGARALHPSAHGAGGPRAHLRAALTGSRNPQDSVWLSGDRALLTES